MNSDQDETHLNRLAVAHYVVGGAMVLFSCLPLIHVSIGLAMIVGGDGLLANAKNPPPPVCGWLFFLAGLAFFVFAQAISISVIVTGRFLQQRKNYTNHRLDLDFNAKSRIRRVWRQVIHLLGFAFLLAW